MQMAMGAVQVCATVQTYYLIEIFVTFVQGEPFLLPQAYSMTVLGGF